MPFQVGARVVRNPATWQPNEFDSWGRGSGVGVVIEPPFPLAPGEVDVRWPGGRCFESVEQLLPAPDITEADEDPFADSDEWIAAEARQLFRALSAYDSKAVEVCLFYLSDYLAKILHQHLRRRPRWQIQGLWFDGLDALEMVPQPPDPLRLTAWLTCVAGAGDNEDWWREPFEFELRLCPRSGQFRGYRFRVGDPRPRVEKKLIGLEFGMAQRIELQPFRIVDLPPRAPEPVGGWLEEIVRGEFPVAGAETDPAAPNPAG